MIKTSPALSGSVLFFVAALHASAVVAQSVDETERQRLAHIAADAARTFADTRNARADQTRPTVPPPPPGLPVEVSLDDAVQRALERNLDISVERLNPQAFDFSIAALEANYRPTFTSTFGMRSQSQFPRSQTAGADMLVTETITGNTGVSQNLKWGGGSVSFAFNNNRQSQSDLFATRNPALNTNFSLNFVQPLLRSFRIDGTRAQLRITQLNQEMSEIDLRATITRTHASSARRCLEAIGCLPRPSSYRCASAKSIAAHTAAACAALHCSGVARGLSG